MVVHKKKNRFANKKLLFGAGLLVLAAVIVLILLEAFDVTHIFHASKAPDNGGTGSATTKGIKPTTKPSAPSPDNPVVGGTTPAPSNPQQSGPVKQNPPDTTAPLIAPSGTFANIYKDVHLSDNMQSTCNTTPGATCQIIFTSGGVTRSLPLKTADGGGAVYWSWKPNDANVKLSPGTWHIIARATLGSQVKTTDNGALELEITP